MVIYPNPDHAPLADVPAAMRERRTVEFIEQMACEGCQVTGGDDTVLTVNLRNLATANGTLERGQAALYNVLNMTHAVRVDIEPQDIEYIFGRNGISFGIARGLEAGVPTIARLLTSIEPGEVFSNLEAASAFVMNDRLMTATFKQR